MSQTTNTAGYGPVAKILHWLLVALLAAQFLLGWTMPDVHRGTKPEGLVAWHLGVGATIIALLVIRFAWRLYRPVPLETANSPRWQNALAHTTHWLLYLVLAIIVLLGWANASARGYPVEILGIIPLPPIAPVGSPFGMRAGDIHGLITWVLLGLIGLHIVGALYHRLILRDRVLQRMLPGA